jgi:hypothetical protein
MDLKDIVAVTGLSGLYKSAAKRNDGMIITSLETGKTTFASARVHMFTPLDTITVYVENNDTTELIKIFAEMKKQEKSNPVPDAKADNPTLKAYFKKILPNYDEEKVYFSDIVKIVKWYRLLDSKGMIDTKQKCPKKKPRKKKKQQLKANRNQLKQNQKNRLLQKLPQQKHQPEPNQPFRN